MNVPAALKATVVIALACLWFAVLVILPPGGLLAILAFAPALAIFWWGLYKHVFQRT